MSVPLASFSFCQDACIQSEDLYGRIVPGFPIFDTHDATNSIYLMHHEVRIRLFRVNMD